MQDFKDINFFVGVNGSGKSQYLNKLAKDHSSYHHNVIAISNTVFDKFTAKRINKLTANHGRSLLQKVIMNVITNENFGDKEDDKIWNFFNILDYLKFDQTIYFAFNFHNWKRDKSLYDILYERLDFSEQLDEFDNIVQLMQDFSTYKPKLGYVMELSFNDYKFDNAFFRIGLVLKFFKRNKICDINILFSKNKNIFKVGGASSGESHFLASMLFLYGCISRSKKNIILIDEPEISLHPKWQKEYILKLYDYFYKYDCQFFLATHSPLIISKLQGEKRDNQKKSVDINYKIFNVKGSSLNQIKEDDDYSIEALYWEVFEVLTPDNSFLSRYCIELLDKYDLKELSLIQVQKEFGRLQSACDLEIQKSTLMSIEKQYLTIERR